MIVGGTVSQKHRLNQHKPQHQHHFEYLVTAPKAFWNFAESQTIPRHFGGRRLHFFVGFVGGKVPSPKTSPLPVETSSEAKMIQNAPNFQIRQDFYQKNLYRFNESTSQFQNFCATRTTTITTRRTTTTTTTASNSNQQQPTTTNNNQQQPTTTNNNRQQPTTTHNHNPQQQQQQQPPPPPPPQRQPQRQPHPRPKPVFLWHGRWAYSPRHTMRPGTRIWICSRTVPYRPLLREGTGEDASLMGARRIFRLKIASERKLTWGLNLLKILCVSGFDNVFCKNRLVWANPDGSSRPRIVRRGLARNQTQDFKTCIWP